MCAHGQSEVRAYLHSIESVDDSKLWSFDRRKPQLSLQFYYDAQVHTVEYKTSCTRLSKPGREWMKRICAEPKLCNCINYACQNCGCWLQVISKD